MIHEVAAYWPARSIGLTCRRFGFMLDPMRYVTKRVDWVSGTPSMSVITTHHLPNGVRHGPGEVVSSTGTTRVSYSHGNVLSYTRSDGAGRVTETRVIYRGVEFRWCAGKMFTPRCEPSAPIMTNRGDVALDEYNSFIESYNGPSGRMNSLC